ncbi:MAG: tetratricopeptide repeat protein, partial [Myxococcales bacterium]|nr:tetratricopeptide repeat protein [Myxococcales bacterium]
MESHSTPPYPAPIPGAPTHPRRDGSVTTAPDDPLWRPGDSDGAFEPTAVPTADPGSPEAAARDPASADSAPSTPARGPSTVPGAPSQDLLAALRRTDDEELTAEHPGRYQLRGVLGEGGIGLVDRVYDRHLRREVALKSLRPVLHGRTDRPVIESRFLDEARVTGLLEHPGIVPVHEVGRRLDGALYYTMKQIRGHNLRAAAYKAGFDERLRLVPRFIGLCQAVAYAHSRGVIHRDLKPDNVMLGDFGETLVVDWGLAKIKAAPDAPASEIDLVPDGRTLDGQVLGTPAYMPPEQLEGRIADVDERADVYALGVILYELITGHTPFGAGTGAAAFAALARRVATEPVPHPATHEPRCPPELAAIMFRALQKDPTRRYRDAGAMVDDMLRFEAGGWVQAHRYSLRERFWRRVRRHRGPLVLALAVLSVAALTWIWRGAREADRAAEAERARQAAVVARVERHLDEARAMRTAGWVDLYASRLTGLKEPVVEDRVVTLLQDPDAALRQLAARTLGLMNSARAVDALIARLDEGIETDETVVVEVIRALGVIGDPRAERAVYAARARYGNTSYVGYATALAYRLLPPEAPAADADANAWVDYGRALVEKGRSAEGVLAYDHAIELQPELVRAWNNRGIAHRYLGNYRLALRDYTRALELDPDFLPTLVNRPILHRNRYDYPAAFADLDHAITLGGSGAARRAGLHNRSLYRAEYGDHEGARQDLDAAAPLGALDRQQMAMEGRIRRLTGELDAALESYNRAIDLDPSSALTYQQRARVHLDRGDLRAARADLDQAWRLDPELQNLSAERAQVLARLGEHVAARQVADDAIATRPGAGLSWVVRAIEVHIRGGDWSAAAADLAQAADRARPSDRVLFALMHAAARRRAGQPVTLAELRPLDELPYHDALIPVAAGAEAPPPPTHEARCALAIARLAAGRG